jgi:hypothetical protein
MQSVTMSRSRHQQQAQPQQGSNPANEVMEVVTINNVPVENAPHHSYRQPEPTDEAYSAHPAHSAHSADGLSDAFQQLKLKPKEFVCEFYDIELVSRNGIVLQYINTNSPNSTCMIGATRINITDPRRIPLYLSRHMSVIRQHAVATLQTHLRLTLCSTGCLERLTPEDYSISFSWATVSELGRQVHPWGRSDLPLSYAAFDNLIAPMWLSKSDTLPTYIVNVYIQLQEPSRRAPIVIQKAKEEDEKRAEIAARPQKAAVSRNNSFNGNGNMNVKNVAKIAAEAAAQSTKSVMESLKRPAPPEPVYPPLPVGAPPEWNKTGRTPIPEGF